MTSMIEVGGGQRCRHSFARASARASKAVVKVGLARAGLSSEAQLQKDLVFPADLLI